MGSGLGPGLSLVRAGGVCEVKRSTWVDRGREAAVAPRALLERPFFLPMVWFNQVSPASKSTFSLE